jgi:hypothetical protein
MKNDNRQSQSAATAALSRCTFLSCFVQTASALAIIGSLALAPSTQAQTLSLRSGDMIYSDSGDAIVGGGIFRVDGQNGTVTPIVAGGFLGFSGFPIGVALDSNNQLIVANEQCLLSIDPVSHVQTELLSASQAGGIWSIAIAPDGSLIVATEQSIVRVNPSTRQTSVITTGGFITHALHLALGGDGTTIFVTNARYVTGTGWIGQIIRVNMQNGQQKVISDGNYLTYPRGIAVSGNDIYVIGCQGHDGNFGVGEVIHVDSHTGRQALVAQGQYLVGPAGITVEENGQLLVTDPYTGLDNYGTTGIKGAVIQIDPATSNQAVILHGSGSFINPLAVMVVH